MVVRFSAGFTGRNICIPTKYVGMRNKNRGFGFRHVQHEAVKSISNEGFQEAIRTGTFDLRPAQPRGTCPAAGSLR